jgi:glycosyltransferase involved in cell wall biosynthesis
VYAIDVAVMTYNSERYLEESLSTLFKAVPVGRLIVVDHYSSDKTVEIAEKYGAEVYYENVGLGYARQLALKHIETPVFYFHDSDVVYYSPYNWAEKILQRFSEEPKIGSVVAKVSYVNYPSPRAKYVRFWWSHVPAMEKQGYTTGSTFIRKEAVEDIIIPSMLDAREDRFIELYILKKKLKIDYVKVEGIHYFDYTGEKGYWAGANERLLAGLGVLPRLLARRILTAPIKAIPPMLAYGDPEILRWNTLHWLSFLKGFLNPAKYRKMKRESKDTMLRIPVKVAK